MAHAVHPKYKITALNVSAIVLGMFCLAYASVPLYDLFCRVTGLGGTTQVAASTEGIKPIARSVDVRFNADVHRGLPWKFYPEQTEMRVRAGEQSLAFYWAENLSDKPVTGTSIYNVTPHKAGPYFSKIECFCFEEQVIQPGEKVRFPVSFFVDPAIADDKNLDDVRTMTLSYTFFEAKQ